MVEFLRVHTEEEVNPLVSAIAAQDKGDARQAIKYLRKAGEIADRADYTKVEDSHVRAAESQVEKETVREAMLEMTTQAQFTLAAITVAELRGTRRLEPNQSTVYTKASPRKSAPINWCSDECAII